MRAKYTFHKTFFSIPDSKQLKLFETLLDTNYQRLECSIKINKDQISASRFGIFYYDKNLFHHVIDILIKFQDEFGLNSTEIISFLKKYSTYAQGVFIGIDQKNEIYRIKIWITFKNQEAIVKDFVNIFDVKFTNFRMDYTICALDILSNGTLDPKIYSVLDCQNELPLIEHLYESNIVELCKHAKLFGPCKRNSTSEEMLSFDLITDLDWFVKILNNNHLNEFYDKLKSAPEFLLFKNTSGLITIARSELEKGEFNHINFYY